MNKEAAVITRPRLEARRQAFLEAATAAFLEKGYANTTLDDIIARSGGSRQTLYALFGGKQGLFAALVAERSNQILGSWEDDSDLLDRPLEQVLVELGMRYLEAVTAPDSLGVYRLVVAECLSMQELAEQFWDRGPGLSRAVLANYFAQQAARGTMLLEDPEQAAHQFWGMLLGNLHMQCLLGLRPAPDRAEIEAYVRTAVARFLGGCRGKLPPPPDT
jgi:TetR/AcrR family transcriptional regulator, mexJK operon transcriptional repressor